MNRTLKNIYNYFIDKETSLFKKSLIVGSLLYFIMPIDLVPDYIVGIGWVDDIIILVFLWLALKSEIDAYVNKEGFKKIKEHKVIPYRKKDDNDSSNK